MFKFKINFKGGRVNYALERERRGCFESWVFRKDFTDVEALSFLNNLERVREIYRKAGII